MTAGWGLGSTRLDGRPTRLVAEGSVSTTRPSCTSSATNAPIVERLRPVSAVSSARDGSPRRWTSSSTVERFRRRTESTVSPRAATEPPYLPCAPPQYEQAQHFRYFVALDSNSPACV